MPQQLCGHSSSHAHIVHMITYTTAKSQAPTTALVQREENPGNTELLSS